MQQIKYIEDIKEYWSTQVEDFKEITVNELTLEQYRFWFKLIEENLPLGQDLKILDNGCGAGFFSIMLAQEGHRVAGIDYNEKMIAAARENASLFGVSDRISLMKMDSQNLSYEDESFDMVISRNLMWILEQPQRAYEEWLRVLKPGGILLNFDANWFLHLHDEKARQRHLEVVRDIEARGMIERYARMEKDNKCNDILTNMPLSGEKRPLWDFNVLSELGCKKITVIPSVEGVLYDEFYELYYKYTPTFMVSAVK